MVALPWLPGSQTTPASAAASAARCMRRLLVQYQATSTTTAHRATSAIIAPAKMTSTWPRSRAVRVVRRRARRPAAGDAGSVVEGDITVLLVGRVQRHDGAIGHGEPVQPGPPKNRISEASGVTAWYVYEIETPSESGLLVLLLRVHESHP